MKRLFRRVRLTKFVQQMKGIAIQNAGWSISWEPLPTCWSDQDLTPKTLSYVVNCVKIQMVNIKLPWQLLHLTCSLGGIGKTTPTTHLQLLKIFKFDKAKINLYFFQSVLCFRTLYCCRKSQLWSTLNEVNVEMHLPNTSSLLVTLNDLHLKLPGESPHRRCSVSRRWSRHHLVANIVIATVSVIIVTNNKMIILHDDGRCEHWKPLHQLSNQTCCTGLSSAWKGRHHAPW